MRRAVSGYLTSRGLHRPFRERIREVTNGASGRTTVPFITAGRDSRRRRHLRSSRSRGQEGRMDSVALDQIMRNDSSRLSYLNEN